MHQIESLELRQKYRPFLPAARSGGRWRKADGQDLRSNWISNSVFDDCDAIIDTACNAWTWLMAQPQTITSIGMRKWSDAGQSK